MSNAVVAQGTAVQYEDPNSPGSWLQAGEVVSFNLSGADKDEIDTTHLLSTAKEFALGLADLGTLELTLNTTPSDSGWVFLRDQGEAAVSVARNFRVTFPDATFFRTSGLIKPMNISGQAEDKLESTLTIRNTGARTWGP